MLNKPHYTDGKTAEELIGHIGFGEPVVVDKTLSRKVLITGAGSYIGETFRTYAEEHYPALKVDAVDMLNPAWREKDFSEYDIVYHVAGIAHADVGNVDEATKAKYYAVNTDLAVEVCEKAKAEGVKEFVFMSSMIVYGDSAPYGKSKIIDEHTVPVAANFYGDSKLQADVAVRDMATDHFKVVVLRPPMIYGKGSKGNYPTLAKIAKKLPVFPNVDNERSMLHIDNLCEFLCQIMLVKEVKENAIVLIPQNAEWTKTTEMVKEIAAVSGKKTVVSGIMKPAVSLGGKVPGKIGGLVNKAFGNSAYAHKMSIYDGLDYQKISLKESIMKTENAKKAKICLISSSGGHFEQLSMLKPLGEKYDTFWVTEKGDYKGNADYYLESTGSNDPRFPIQMTSIGVNSIKIWRKEKPDFVVSTGTMVAIPMCILAKAFGKKVIYIETFARVTDCTRAGKLMYKIADLFIYQWEELEKFYPNGVYGGSIY